VRATSDRAPSAPTTTRARSVQTGQARLDSECRRRGHRPSGARAPKLPPGARLRSYERPALELDRARGGGARKPPLRRRWAGHDRQHREPKSNIHWRIAGQPDATDLLQQTHRARHATPVRMDEVGPIACRTGNASCDEQQDQPFRASSMAVGPPAQRAPTTITSCMGTSSSQVWDSARASAAVLPSPRLARDGWRGRPRSGPGSYTMLKGVSAARRKRVNPPR